MTIEPLWLVRAVYSRRASDSRDSAERVMVDGDTYVEALALLGDAWELRAFIRYRSVVSYVANVEPRPLDLRQWIAGRESWSRNYRSS